FQSWMTAVLGKFHPADAVSAAPSTPLNQPARYSKQNPFPGRLLRNVLLTKPGSGKEVRHYEISLHGSELQDAAGDALGVVPVNCPDLVQELLTILGCSGDESVALQDKSMELREALTRRLDITKPSPDLLAAVAQRVPDGDLARLRHPDRRDELKQWLWG